MNKQILIGTSILMIIFTVLYFMFFSKSENLLIKTFKEDSTAFVSQPQLPPTHGESKLNTTIGGIRRRPTGDMANTLLAFSGDDGHVVTDYNVSDLSFLAYDIYRRNEQDRTQKAKDQLKEDINFRNAKIRDIKAVMDNVDEKFIRKSWMDNNVVKRGGKYNLKIRGEGKYMDVSSYLANSGGRYNKIIKVEELNSTLPKEAYIKVVPKANDNNNHGIKLTTDNKTATRFYVEDGMEYNDNFSMILPTTGNFRHMISKMKHPPDNIPSYIEKGNNKIFVTDKVAMLQPGGTVGNRTIHHTDQVSKIG